MTAHHRVVHPGGRRREGDDALGDPVAGVGLHLERQLVELGTGRRRADHQSLAARAVDPLEDELVAAGERVLADGVVHQVHRLDVLQDRVLAQVVADHGRHVGVDELVVGHAVPHPVGDRHPSGPRRVDDARTAHQRLGAELQRVEILVVDAAVDHVHRDLALGGAEEDVGAVADEVAALHQVHAHEAGQQRVLVEGRVVHARRQHDHRRVLHRRRRGAAQRVDQASRVVGDHLNGLAPEQLGQHPRHGGAVGQHVAHPGRAPQVVLQHAELAVLVTDHVDARHVDAHAVGRRVAVGRPHEPRGARDHLVRDEPVADDAGGAVDVGQEELERPHPLGHPRRHLGPLGAGEDPGHHVEGERSLLAVEVEGDPLVHEGPGQPGARGPRRPRGPSGPARRPRRRRAPGPCRRGRPSRRRRPRSAHGPTRRSRRRGLPRSSGCQACVSPRFHGREQPVTAPGRAGSDRDAEGGSSLHPTGGVTRGVPAP